MGAMGLTMTHEEISTQSTSTDIPGYAPGMKRIDDREDFGVLGRIDGLLLADGLGELPPRVGLWILF